MSEQVAISVKRMNRIEGEGNARAFCDVAIAETFLVKGIRVVEGKRGLFVSMPQEKGKDGQWYGTVIPLSKQAHQQISQVVLKAYRCGADSESQE